MKNLIRYFDDQARDGTAPTYSWTELNLCSPFDDWGYMRSNLYTYPITVVSGGALFVGAIIDPGHFHICYKYNMESGLWEELDNGTDIEYDSSDFEEPSVIALDSHIYVIGGMYYDTPCRSISKFDIAKECWVDCCYLKTGVAECNLVIMDKKVLILDTKCYREDEEHTAIIQMYDPANNESFIVLDAAGLEKDGLRNEDLQLTVQSDLCYVICDPAQDRAVNDVDDSDGASSSQVERNPRVFEQNPRVFKLVCNLDSNPLSIVVGEEIPQTHPHQNNYIRAFCIEGKTFVNVRGCVHKIKDGIANEEDLKKWRNITKTLYRPVHFTYDRRVFEGITDDKDEGEDDDEEEGE